MSGLMRLCLALLLLAGCDSGNSTKKANPRFQVVETFVFNDRGAEGKIMEDTVTGKQLLYVWDGMGNGGPAIMPWDCPSGAEDVEE